MPKSLPQIEDELHATLKVHAARQRTTIGAVVSAALSDYLRQRGEHIATAPSDAPSGPIEWHWLLCEIPRSPYAKPTDPPGPTCATAHKPLVDADGAPHCRGWSICTESTRRGAACVHGDPECPGVKRAAGLAPLAKHGETLAVEPRD